MLKPHLHYKHTLRSTFAVGTCEAVWDTAEKKNKKKQPLLFLADLVRTLNSWPIPEHLLFKFWLSQTECRLLPGRSPKDRLGRRAAGGATMRAPPTRRNLPDLDGWESNECLVKYNLREF